MGELCWVQVDTEVWWAKRSAVVKHGTWWYAYTWDAGRYAPRKGYAPRKKVVTKHRKPETAKRAAERRVLNG